MLNPESHRMDYGEHLSPPAGYELDCAIATTYSLDLDALLATPVALCFHDTLEGDLRGERLALLEAIGQLKGRIKVFDLATVLSNGEGQTAFYVQPIVCVT